jgi:condensin-2 complex subunit G2
MVLFSTDLVAEHASDASSSAVRAGALNAVALLLVAPQSHAVLRPLLPSIGNLIHDKVDVVRLAAVHLLHAIKKTPGIKYYHVVPVDHLTARLADEGRVNPQSAVASALTSLMLNSYFPQGKTGNEQMQRTLTFLTTDPLAANVFYSNLSEHLPIHAVAQLAAMLLRCLHSAVESDRNPQAKLLRQVSKQTKTTGNKKRRKFGKRQKEALDSDIDDEQDGEPSEEGGDRTNHSVALMAALAETICTLWQSIEKKLEKDDDCNQSLINQFSGATLTSALTHFEQKATLYDGTDDDGDTMQARDDCYRACAAILRLAGRLPSKAVEGLVPHISSVLSGLTESCDQTRQNVSSHIALLCLWGMTEEVAPSLAASIEIEFEVYHELLFASPVDNSKKRKTGFSRTKSTAPLAFPQLPPIVALDVLGDILRGSDPSSVAAREVILSSDSSCNAIERALERGTKHAENLLSTDSVSCAFACSIQWPIRPSIVRVLVLLTTRIDTPSIHARFRC